MKIATWNVNSVRTRIANILDWIKKENPDILCLQEIKVITESFPREVFEDLGYNLIINGQKSYNGVATLSKYLIEDSIEKIPMYEDDQARYIETIHSVNSQVIRIINISNISKLIYMLRAPLLFKQARYDFRQKCCRRFSK